MNLVTFLRTSSFSANSPETNLKSSVHLIVGSHKYTMVQVVRKQVACIARRNCVHVPPC